MAKSSRTSHTFHSEPTGAAYVELLELATSEGMHGLVIVREIERATEKTKRLLERLRAAGATTRLRSSWPGTELVGHTATSYQFLLDEGATRILQDSARGLFDWQAPDLPEDLCVLREDGSTWLGSIAHEKDAWVEWDEAEIARYGALAPAAIALLLGKPS